ncbi:Na+/H+ antiporter subunit A [Schaalia vaccimaxillae]|uniref:Na+/H+ antiporter subunit A n=1 Tax=Schaalia vaccimaxillae TaxID=183916 RepID=UPI0003B555D0|nr:Na+/H+ antiporter subunit A [Schaalia vaccimaxillae]
MLVLIAVHLCAAILAAPLVAKLGRRSLALLAVAPAAAVVYTLTQAPMILSGEAITRSVPWVPGLDLSITMRMDSLSWVMTLIVGGVGAAVLVYASRYFTDSSQGLRRFAAVFTAFVAAMLGLVNVDHSMGLYVFWEATSILSFLLIGHHYDRRPARLAARQALLVTSSGSLAMFAGFVMLAHAPGGSYSLSELVESAAIGGLAVGSAQVIVGALLVLAGAFSKSALVPTHFWLPGAMAAPTPVSAYLHAAAMVKAGVYLVARLTPGLTNIDAWSPVIVIFGLTTMIVGGWRALKQFDLKLVLAYGTVSQLGLITAAVGYGSASVAAAGITMLVAHAFFKSTLFLIVGAVESATGTRDLRRLSGLGKRKPVLAGAGTLAAASMAGIPLTTGYLGKEAFITALLHGSEAAWSSHTLDLLILAVLAVGSVLTSAYSWRAWWGAFGVRDVPADPESANEDEGEHTQETTHCLPTPPMMTVSIGILSLGALAGLAPAFLEKIIVPIGGSTPGTAHLAWWSGWGPASVTGAILAVAAVLAWRAKGVESWQLKHTVPLRATEIYAWSLREIEIVSASITHRIQRGSLPWDLSTIFVTFVALVGSALVLHTPSNLTIRWADSWVQIVLALVIIVAAVGTVRSRGRLRAVVALGAVGLGVAVLFASQGAPDLAITQVVVEAVSIIVFVLVLRRLPRFFSDRPLARSRWWRLVVAVAVGSTVVIAGLFASSSRIHNPVSEIMPNEAKEFGHGLNIVNVILVDIRAWDTVGELSVLLVIATGVASLLYVRARSGRIERAPSAPNGHEASGGQTPRAFLRGVIALEQQDRSIVLEVVTRLLFPTMLVISVWLLMIGHNNPGGGFAGGVVAGLAFVLRYLAGGRHELGEAMPIPAGRILGLGLFIAGASAMAPLLFGNAVLESVAVDLDLGLLGHLHFTTAMVLDVGVYVLVVGLILDLISATGSQIDRDPEEPDGTEGLRDEAVTQKAGVQ